MATGRLGAAVRAEKTTSRPTIPSSASRSGPVRGARAAITSEPTRAPTAKLLNSAPLAARLDPTSTASAGNTTGKAPIPMNDTVVATVTERSAGVFTRWARPAPTVRRMLPRAPDGAGIGTRSTASSATVDSATHSPTAAVGDTADTAPANPGPATPATLYDVDSAP